MPTTDNYTKYECDRCAKTSFLTPTDPGQSDFTRFNRVNLQGAQQEFLLCRDCYQAYQRLAQTQEQQIITLLANPPQPADTETTDGEAM